MKFKTGDKVKFLNTKGGGVVTRIMGKDMVEVTIEDGFGIPVMEHEIIHTGTVQDPSANIFRGDPKSASSKPAMEPTTTRAGIQDSLVPGNYNGRQLEPGLYMAFRPMDQRILTMGDLEVILVNYHQTPLVIQLYLKKDGKFHFRKQLSLRPMQAVILEQISRTELESWLSGTLQMMAQPPVAAQLPLPVHTSFAIKGSKFFRADGYEHTNLDPQLIIPVLLKLAAQIQPGGAFGSPSAPLWGHAQAPVSDSSRAFGSPSTPLRDHAQAPLSKTPEPPPFVKRHLTPEGDAEVDLHIHAITDNHQRLNPMESLNYQLSYFRKVLNSAIAERVPKLIVIHGVGAGILKAEIGKEVAEIDFAHLYDAPLHKYGVGASVIEFFHTKNR